MNGFHLQKGLWIRSAGPDGTYSPLPGVLAPTYGGAEGEDDIVISIAKVKF